MNLMDLLQGNLPDNLLGTLTNQVGAESTDQTKVAAQGAISALAAALSKNASTPGGANALVSALDRDHDGSILDDLAGFFGGSRQASNQSMLNGAGILKHVLGGNQNNIINMISRMSGLDQTKAGSMLTMLAPVILGALGKARNQQNMGVNDLTKLLGGSVQEQAQSNRQFGLVQQLLDRDGDGSIMDDIANIGLSFLKKRQ